MAPPRSAVTLAGKGFTLSSDVVYSVACGLSYPAIDSAAADKLSTNRTTTMTISNPSAAAAATESGELYLTSDEARAALVVLLNKLVVSEALVRSTIPDLIVQTIASSNPNLQSINFSTPFTLVKSLCDLIRKNCDEIGVTSDEIGVVNSSNYALIGLCALIDCCSSALSRIIDAVAAISCEASRVAVESFDLFGSGDGLSVKDETDVASDMKILIFGSKLSGQVSSSVINEIPTVHGSFREVSRLLHNRIRIELNSIVKVKKNVIAFGSRGKEKALTAVVLPVMMAVQAVGENSLERMKLVIDSISDSGRKSKLVEIFEKNCPKMETLREEFRMVSEKATCGFDYTGFLRGVYDFVVKLRRILAWEAALALFAIESDESIGKPQVNGETAKNDKKSDKKKKKTLGRGTSIIRQLLTEIVDLGTTGLIEDVGVLSHRAEELSLYFDPKDARFDTLLTKIKEIVESNEVRRLPKIPKGTRDFGKEQMAIRDRAFSIITGVFKRHGAVALDTPVFELRETLMGKYGEDSKLIYDLADQGGELCSLRYDLTVPFARYLAMNSLNSLKRYQIAKVYRRDNPSKGRYREFYQCDFDIAGQYEPMEPDFEVIRILTELLNELNIGDYEIKLNHRKLLDGMFEICGVSSEKFRTVCSSIDKLDKQTFDQVKKELVEEKGVPLETAEKIGSFVRKRGPPLEILSDLKREGSPFLENIGSLNALNDLEILFTALAKSSCLDKVVLDLSLARGLDYYTGVIFEAIFKGATQVGSIAAGGRYDNLVGMFSGKQVPAVGVSLGIERVFTIMEQHEKDRNQVIRATETQVLVAVLGKDLSLAAELVSRLWDAKIKAEFGLTKRVMNHINRAKQSGIPWMLIVGESELSTGVFKLKNIEANQEEEIPRERFVEELRSRLNIS